jgi:hypothetical protein
VTTVIHPWLAEMQRLRARTGEPGLANPGHAAALGGLALLQAMIEGRIVAGGKRTTAAEGRLVDAEGRLYSHGTTTCLFLEAAA